jgi:hypothetical protein
MGWREDVSDRVSEFFDAPNEPSEETASRHPVTNLLLSNYEQ